MNFFKKILWIFFNFATPYLLNRILLRLKIDIFLISTSRRIEWYIETSIFLKFNSENPKFFWVFGFGFGFGFEIFFFFGFGFGFGSETQTQKPKIFWVPLSGWPCFSRYRRHSNYFIITKYAYDSILLKKRFFNFFGFSM